MTNTILKTIALSGLVLAGTSQFALADTIKNNRVVSSSNGAPIETGLSQTCVRTNWENPNNTNVCGKTPEVKPQPAQMLHIEDRTVTFSFDSAKLTDDAKQRLNSLAGALNNTNNIREVTILGYTDKIGPSEYNKKLSVERAHMVKDYLASQGYINTKVAELHGYGEQDSVTNCTGSSVNNDLIQCLQPDRRVEVQIQFLEPVQTSAYNESNTVRR